MRKGERRSNEGRNTARARLQAVGSPNGAHQETFRQEAGTDKKDGPVGKGSGTMAYETKVGLLVGLGFIVCFAVVLSHRGKADELSAQMAYEMLTRHGAGERSKGTTIPNGFARQVPAAAEGAPATAIEKFGGQGRDAVGDAPPVRTGDGPSSAAPEKAVSGDGRVRLASAPMAGGAESAGLDHHGGTAEATGGTHQGALPPGPGVSMESVFGSAFEPAADVAAVVPDAGLIPAIEGSKPGPRNAAEPRGERYVVRPKDTLWSIAGRAYGRATQDTVNRIVEANRGRLGPKNVLPVGAELILPATAGAGGRSAETSAPRNLTRKVDSGRARPEVKSRPGAGKAKSSGAEGRDYYQVQPGDRYASLAEKLLGDKSKWHELYELNKDIFPDPGSIRHGVRIRVPERKERVSGGGV